MFRSLRFKIVLVLILINSISFIMMNLINYETSNKQMNKQLIKHSMINLKSTVANLNTKLALRIKEAELVRHTIPQDLKTIELQLAFLREDVPLSNLLTTQIGIAGIDGSMIMLDGTVVPVGGIEAYQQALKGDSGYSHLLLDVQGKPMLWLMVPRYNSFNGIIGTIGFALDPSQLFGDQLNVRSSEYEESAIILVDRDTNILYYSKESPILMQDSSKDEPAIRDFAQQMGDIEEGYGEGQLYGRSLKMFYLKIPNKDWYAVFSIAKEEFEAPFRRASWMNVGLIALTEIILGICLFIIAQKSILNRLKQVVEVTKNVAAGNFYTRPLDIQSQDEMGTLSSSVNGMIENLQNLFEPFQAFIHHNQYAMIVTNSEFVITAFNQRAVEILGYEENEVIGRKSLLLWHDHDQLHDRANFYSDTLKRTIAMDESLLFLLSQNGFLPDWEWIWINREGTRIRVSLNPSVMRYPDGTIKGYVLIARDISEIKQAVEMNTRLLEIMASAHDMIASFDLRGSIFYLNQAGHAFLGIEAISEHNQRLSQYMPIPMTVKFADGLTEAQKHGFWQSEIEFINVNNEVQMTSITVVAHRTHDDSDTFFSTIVRDISEQKEIELQLVNAKNEADLANEAKSTFLARMSHEIRTPLNGIIGLTYLLQRSELTKIQADYLLQISDSSQNLLRILNDILDFSKFEADKLTLEQLPFRVEESLNRLGGIFSVLLGTKNIDFIIHLDPQVPDWLIGDPTRLEQVLLNLGTNAIKFTNIGLIELAISLVDIANGQARLNFQVIDSGIGMTQQQLDQLFRPFVQVDEKTSRKYGGTGLGLVISQTIIESMGGKINVDSLYHGGSTFSFELIFPIDNKLPLPIKPYPLGLKIIVLEDNDLIAKYWSSLLSSFGCHVVTVSSWEHAKTHLHELKWDLFIVDMEAGDMHGEETWKNWKTVLDAHEIKIISNTSLLGRDALHQLPDEYKPMAVLVKPVTPLQLQQALQVFTNSKADKKLIPHSEEAIKYPNQSPFHSSLRILVVDDQIINRLVVKQLLSQSGFEVELLESGSEAVAVTDLEHSNVNLILMDLHMPGMDGIEATIEIRRRFSSEQLPIIALTADITKEQHVKCLAAGMNDILTKPIEPDILLAVLSKWLPLPLPVSPSMIDKDILEWPITPGIDVSLALSRLDGKSMLYLQLLDKFLAQHTETYSKLNILLNEGNRKGAIRLVHSLSGAAGHLGATAIQEAASTMEKTLEDNEDILQPLDALSRALQEGLESINSLTLQKRS
ncbi:response regulator [Cohnella sp. WQ 127256]|uniref:response regulator n=1 Tax=Cohnella sp. WQ 127256 TaxID=2938790 RepID=UPI00211902C5|nr:response regulator [Cohnella sp. WQ 127256]